MQINDQQRDRNVIKTPSPPKDFRHSMTSLIVPSSGMTFSEKSSPGSISLGGDITGSTNSIHSINQPVVHMRRNVGVTHEHLPSNRHSYHGVGSLIPDRIDDRFLFARLQTQNPHAPYEHIYASPTPIRNPNIGHAPIRSQRSFEDSSTRCIRKRISANFGNQLSVLPEGGDLQIMMNSNDSLHTTTSHRRDPIGVDTMQQGAEMQESPRGSMVSGMTSKRTEEVSNTAPAHHHMIPQGSIPIQGQVLVDPATGQHYIVPQTAFYHQPMAPHMYYPPPQPTPMYYPYPPQPQDSFGKPSPAANPKGYVLQTAQQPHGGYAAIPMQYTAAATPSSRHPSAPSSHITHPQRGFSATPPTYHRQYPHNNIAASSNEDISRRENERYVDREEIPPPSPSFSTHSVPAHMYSGIHSSAYSQPTQTTSFAQQYIQTQQQRSSPNSQPEDPESGRDGFRRDVTRSSAEFSRPLNEFTRQTSGELTRSSENFVRMGSAEFGKSAAMERTPLYGGPPQWWGRGKEEGNDSLTDIESRRLAGSQRISPPAMSTASDGEPSRPTTVRFPAAKPVRMDIDFNKPMPNVETATPKPTIVARSPSIRMDIDLSKRLPEEDEEEINKLKAAAAAAASRVPATAFTVSFDTPGEGVSLQDAARKSAQARRILGRRSGGNLTAPSTASSQRDEGSVNLVPTQGSNKSYLLNKLLHGGEGEAGADIADLEEKKDNDMVSEAGTYVVDMATRGNTQPSHMMQSRIVEDSSTESDTDSGSDSDDGTPVPEAKNTAPAPSVGIKPAPKDENSSEMMRGLMKLRQMAAGNRPNTAPVTSAPVQPSSRVCRPSLDSRPGPANPPLSRGRVSIGNQPTNRSVLSSSASSRQHASNAHNSSVQSGTTNNTNQFRRGDGGRFSMRGGPQPTPPGSASPSNAQAKRPPFRAGGAPVKPMMGNPVQQREQEMNAWLRRKDYNPMRAAAEAKKSKDLKASLSDLSQATFDIDTHVSSDPERGDQFMSNRSISFHVGPTPPKGRVMPDFGELMRNRSEESLAQDEADQASQKVLAEYSRGVVKDLNRLSEQSRAGGNGKQQLNGLARAVDMLSQKCKKSIELIRSQNKGCLSVSVEDLLATAAEPPRADESLNEQLDRLSDAFDAVQRYLEQYSLDGHQSPIPEFCEENPDVSSAVSGFSSFSLGARRLSEESNPATQFGGSLGTTSTRPLKTTAYRSRILAGRSPSNGAAKNN